MRINMTLRDLIWEAWGAPFDFSRFIGGPKDMDSPCWQVLAKAPVEENALHAVPPKAKPTRKAKGAKKR